MRPQIGFKYYKACREEGYTIELLLSMPIPMKRGLPRSPPYSPSMICQGSARTISLKNCNSLSLLMVIDLPRRLQYRGKYRATWSGPRLRKQVYKTVASVARPYYHPRVLCEASGAGGKGGEGVLLEGAELLMMLLIAAPKNKRYKRKQVVRTPTLDLPMMMAPLARSYGRAQMSGGQRRPSHQSVQMLQLFFLNTFAYLFHNGGHS